MRSPVESAAKFWTPEVHANGGHRPSIGCGWGFEFQGKARVPAVGGPANRHVANPRRRWQPSVPLHLDVPNAVECQAAFSNGPGRGPGKAVVPMTRTKARIAGLLACGQPAEEGLERELHP